LCMPAKGPRPDSKEEVKKKEGSGEKFKKKTFPEKKKKLCELEDGNNQIRHYWDEGALLRRRRRSML